MLIKDIFEKKIDRDIKGVVKVEQDDLQIIDIELSEYVVTKELQRHFRDFFSAYTKGIATNSDKIGVWISGFFGSGKSHFLKILSYLLANEDINGKKPIDYFIEDDKIKDSAVLADVKLALSKPTEVILFNIDSKSETTGTKDDDTVLHVFLKVFNEKLGYSTNPHVADLERQLVDDNKYKEFKDKYKEISGEDWVSSRHKFSFRKDHVIKSLSQITYMTEEMAQVWAKSTVIPYETSIDKFAKMVKVYLDKKGKEHQLLFLVDEVGQFIGDNSDLMLTLQTIEEDLGRVCRGRSWLVVTSQQDIDSITEVMGRDFSKIQGRFDTRLSLTSANVDEVIKLRILKKKQAPEESLKLLYDNKETIIKNLITFDDSVEKKLYDNKKDFAQVYPFVPYQFDILSVVLTSVREHSSSGKHLSDGERSMLALFKESAEKYMNDKVGRIIPFNLFYDALEKFLDHSHSAVITKALANSKINPQKEEENFAVNVLKVLFLIKYVNEVASSSENITSLMVSHIDEDRIELKNKVEDALCILESQMLVQKNGEIYIFLTNEEQEINRLINNKTIENIQLTKEIGDMIFSDIFPDERIEIGKIKNRYIYPFNRMIDDLPFRAGQSFEFGVKIVSPNSELNGNESTIMMQSSYSEDVYVDLPADYGFIKELSSAIKIRAFLNDLSAAELPGYAEIRDIKRREMEEHNNRARLFLQESLKESKFYISGSLLDLSVKDFKHNLTDALQNQAKTIYHKLDYIAIPKSEIDIRNLFKEKDKSQMALGSTVDNINAINALLEFIRDRTRNHTMVSLREIKNNFYKAPYGFTNDDINWIVGKAFIAGQIAMSIGGSQISIARDSVENIVDYITKRTHEEKLLIVEKQEISDQLKKILKGVYIELFKENLLVDDSDMMAKRFNDNVNDLLENIDVILRAYVYSRYPGRSTLENGKTLLLGMQGIDTMDLFDYVSKHEDELLDFNDDYVSVKAFMEGEGKNIWERTLNYVDIFKASETYIMNDKIEATYAQMLEITRQEYPYNRIPELPALNEDFWTEFSLILDDEMEPIVAVIEEQQQIVMDALDVAQLEGAWASRFRNSFLDLKERAQASNNIAQLKGYSIEADAMKIRFLSEIDKEVIKNQKTNIKDGNNKVDTVENLKKQKNISIREINKISWRIEKKEDIDKYLDELKRELENNLQEDIILNIKF